MAITIKNGAKVLYQWERGVALTVTSPCNLVRVSREDDKVGVELTPSWSGSTGTVIIPDRLLTESGYLHAARVDTTGDEERILETARFLVRSAQKPGNNAAATKEVKEWEELQMRMDAIERAAREGDFDGKDGEKGDQGIQGEPGITPHIGEDFHWYIGDVDTGVIARGIDGGQIEPFCYTYGIANNDDPTAFAATVTGAMEFSINPGVIYIKGVARKFAKMTITRLTHDFDQNYVVLCRYDEASGEISYLFREVTLQGSLIISIEDAARLPMRQSGKYDLLLWLIKIPAGTTTITQDMLVDLRANEAYCGYVRSKIYALERPSIGANGNWFIGDEDTGVKAQGEDGDDYVLTESDKNNIAEQVKDMVGKLDGDAIDNKVSEHNASDSAHNDIRQLLAGLNERLNGIANSEDVDLDQLAEIVAYIKANRDLISQVTDKKVNVTDIIDNLTTSVSNKPLSAKMGVQLKQLIDAIEIPVTSVNGKTGDVVIKASNVWYGECTSGAASSTKVVNTVTGDFAFENGNIIIVRFQNSANMDDLLMTVDGTGAHRVYADSGRNHSFWHRGDIVAFACVTSSSGGYSFNRLNWNKATMTTYGTVVLSDEIWDGDSSLNTAATPAAVKKAYDLAMQAYEKTSNPDWNQNDETAGDYVKNRTHWLGEGHRVIIPASEKGTHSVVCNSAEEELRAGQTYIVTCGDMQYERVAYTGTFSDKVFLGDSRLSANTGDLAADAHPDNVPFLVSCTTNIGDVDDSYPYTRAVGVYHTLDDRHATVAVNAYAVEDGIPHPLDDTYIPDSVARARSVVRHDSTQNLTVFEKRKARENIGAIGEDDIEDVLIEAKNSGAFDGKDGVSPTATLTKDGRVTTFSVTDVNGTQTVQILDGADGAGSGEGAGGAGVDFEVVSELLSDGVIVSEFDDAASVLYDGWKSGTETGSVILKQGAVVVYGAMKYFDTKTYDLYMPSTKDNRIAFGFRMNTLTGEIEEKVWTDYEVVVTGADGIPTKMKVGTDFFPARHMNNNYDIVVGLIVKPKGAASFNASMITDTRAHAKLCGHVESKVCPTPEAGGTSIDVTAEVGQTIRVKEVGADGKPVSWESVDYQPRTHWLEDAEVLPETTIQIDPEQGMGVYQGKVDIHAGDECIVTYNGVDYACKALIVVDEVCLGNMGALNPEDHEDTGEPFVLMCGFFADFGGYALAVASLDGSETVNLRIVGKATVKIPERYLPEKQTEVLTGTFEGSAQGIVYKLDGGSNMNHKIREWIFGEHKAVRVRLRAKDGDDIRFLDFDYDFMSDGDDGNNDTRFWFKCVRMDATGFDSIKADKFRLYIDNMNYGSVNTETVLQQSPVNSLQPSEAPITAAAVYNAIGDIEELLGRI